jgi:hypothetical protein
VFSVRWDGFVEVLLAPELDPARPGIVFRVVDSNALDRERRKRHLGARVWDLVKDHVHPRLATFRLDLAEPVGELRALLPLVLPGTAERLDRLLASLALRAPDVRDEGVGVTVVFAVEAAPAPPAPPAPALSPDEIARWEAVWQRWDAFLTFVVKDVARDAAGDVRRDALAVLLDARHDLLEALAPQSPGAPDPVPGLFVRAWEALRPVLRQAGPGLPHGRALRYLSFVAGGDALAALVHLGPGFGLDVSADGLRRLARTLAPTAPEDPLAYSTAVDPDLRALLGLGPPLAPPEISPDVAPDLLSWLVRPAFAGLPAADLARLNRWAPARGDLDEYLPLVRRLLVDVADTTLAGAKLRADARALFRPLVLATAWQESCWRQYVRGGGGKLTPLRSSVGSVGLMQVNVHVWRGVYEVRGLHGDIAYNGRAGSEILLHYLRDHAVRAGEDRYPDGLARSTYAIYNGGPGHRARYRAKTPRASLARIDKTFLEKYRAVRAGREMEVARCWG